MGGGFPWIFFELKPSLDPLGPDLSFFFPPYLLRFRLNRRVSDLIPLLSLFPHDGFDVLYYRLFFSMMDPSVSFFWHLIHVEEKPY